jgi:hypothetical protein
MKELVLGIVENETVKDRKGTVKWLIEEADHLEIYIYEPKGAAEPTVQLNNKDGERIMPLATIEASLPMKIARHENGDDDQISLGHYVTDSCWELIQRLADHALELITSDSPAQNIDIQFGKAVK